ncbi:MAG: glycosyltransferase family 4 protein [Candidatus Levybacteria bacterium]|nr:glycosyltransferase family 4 protein [Candidatus Levybacteria bacterium]
MIIGIDGNEANIEKKVGISEYCFELLQQLSNFQFQISDVQFRIYLKDEPRKDMPKQRQGWEYRIVHPKKLWTQFGLPLDLYFHKPRPDVFFSPTHYAPRFSPIPTVVSIMDVSYEFFPDLFRKSDLYKLKRWTEYSVKNATKVLTISQASKNDIMQVYNVPEEKVVVTYLGLKKPFAITKIFSSMKELQEKFGIPSSYILFVGTLQPRKNIERLIQAFQKIAIRKEDTDLVIVGKPGWLYEDIINAPKKYGIEKRVHFLSFVAEDELISLYKNAACFVLPSLYEGFGLPVLEAMSYDCPVITSNISSLPEAGGDAALYIDPENIDELAKNMEDVLSDKKLRAGMIEKGRKQVQKFSWEKTARETLKVLEEVAKNKR